MRDEIINRLLRLNQQFYQTFAEHFVDTRTQLQPGVMSVLDTIPSEASVLDIGCGHGEVASELERRGHYGTYLGLDSSVAFLSIANRKCKHPRARFKYGDLADPSWFKNLSLPTEGKTKDTYNRILAFAVLHHLPGQNIRLNTVHNVHSLLADDGQFVHSNWNFIVSPHLRDRIVPWEAIGLTQGDVDQGDYLLDWRRGGYGLRYVHLFNQEELQNLAKSSNFRVVETFYSDGEGGRLGLYQVWERL
jgi:SAM-dependent methyltransferase